VALLRARRGEPSVEVTPAGANVRSRVHEYGGGAYCTLPGDRVAWVDAADQRVYAGPADGSSPPRPLSPAAPDGERHHHGDLRAGGGGGGAVLAVRERHRNGMVARGIVRYDGAGSMTVVASGRDFFSAPRPSPDGRALAYVAWDHPDMSWDASELWVVGRDGDGPAGQAGPFRMAGGDGVSVGQPWWADDDTVVFASDADTGWWQPWRATVGSDPARLSDIAAEFHGPDWALGQATMAPAGAGAMVCRYRSDAIDRLGLLDLGGGELTPVPVPCTTIGAVVAHDGGVVCLGRTEEAPAALWWAPIALGAGRPSVGAFAPFGVAPPVLVPPRRRASPEPFHCDGPEGRTVHGLFFALHADDVAVPDGERPPLLVFCHGGPTGSAEAGFDVTVQFFTTRGFAVALVDYAGSTGYGRAVRESLYGRWGEADSDDCVAAATHLAASGRVDGDRMAIRGSSAGGLTALNALVRSRVFAAAASWYGVTDLLGLEATTHDFESRYNHRLVGPLPGSEETYRRRSPVNRVDDMAGAVLLLYGLDDPVVPPAQARDMAAALRRRGVDCEEVAFEGEGHGFRRADTVSRCLEAELAFYRRTLVGDRASGP
jgi:dienelactone hydrolase